jgi:hypothetical protein
MHSPHTIHGLGQLLPPPGRHNLVVCLDAARRLCEWLLTAGGRQAAVRECQRLQERLRDALAETPADGVATVQRLLAFLRRASAGEKARGGDIFFDPLDLARDPERFWRRVGWPEARAELRACHTLLLHEVQAAAPATSEDILAREGTCLFGVPAERFGVIHCYTVPWTDSPAITPPVVMIATRALVGDKGTSNAWHLVAEAEGIPLDAIRTHQADLERRVLQTFLRDLKESPRTWWLHWNMNSIQYGFPALAQRAKALKLGEVRFPEKRMLDLSEVLKVIAGEEFIPHPRLENLITLNEINDYELLDLPGLTAAFRTGD